MKITSSIALGALVACSLLTTACDDAKKDAAQADAGAAKKEASASDEKKSAADAKPAADANADANAAEGADKAEEAKADGAAGSAAEGELPTIGVEACDDYIKAMTACFDRDVVPENISEAQREGFGVTVRGWADAVKSNPGSKDQIAIGCEAASDMAKRSYPKCFE